MVSLIIYTLRIKGFVLPSYSNSWMTQKINCQCYHRKLDISNRKFIIKLNHHHVICVTQTHVSERYY